MIEDFTVISPRHVFSGYSAHLCKAIRLQVLSANNVVLTAQSGLFADHKLFLRGGELAYWSRQYRHERDHLAPYLSMSMMAQHSRLV
ncbi:hypothetical protein P692DRAFT_20838822 [Suillus brevipes Sb2]|nr:hypothetical protein P692DRAFT_20838822 [Suillus brevipes Sb2]